jgi:hypothetical protein
MGGNVEMETSHKAQTHRSPAANESGLRVAMTGGMSGLGLALVREFRGRSAGAANMKGESKMTQTYFASDVNVARGMTSAPSVTAADADLSHSRPSSAALNFAVMAMLLGVLVRGAVLFAGATALALSTF